MAPTESSILTSFLLSPASLPTIITLQKFRSLFPRSLQSHPQVEALYREIQHARALTTDRVKENIAVEVQKGVKQRREVARLRRKAQKARPDAVDRVELEMEVQLFGPTSNVPKSNPHTLESMTAEMEDACVDIEKEIAMLEENTNSVFSDLTNVVGDLSDLRYGRLHKPGTNETVREQVIEGLEGLADACYKLSE